MTKEEKALRYDEIVRVWNEALTEDSGEVRYLIAGFPLATAIQSVIKDDLNEYIEVN